MNSRLLRIYLQDHHAASAGGVALARRALGPSHPLAEQIARDRDALERVMRQLAVTPNALKVGIVRVAELVGRLKLNGRIFERSPLSSVVELETLVVGVRGKEALWTSLQRAGVSLEDVDLDALVESARAQGAELEALRLSAAEESVRLRLAGNLGRSGSRVNPPSSGLVVLLVGLLLLAGCGGSEEAEPTGDPGEITFDLDEVGDAGVAGVRATLTYETPERTTVTVDGLDEGEPAGGGANPVLLRSGTCDEPKDIVFELEELSGATSETTVELAITALLNGDYNIQVGLPDRPDDVVACGDVPQEVAES